MRPVVLLALVACAPVDESPASFIEPMDGFTGWPDDEPLWVVSPDLDVPADYEIRDLIRVVDLADGGDVAGSFDVYDGRVRFDPDDDWVVGHRFAWTVDVPPAVPHGPQWSIPADLAGTAVFDTDPALEALDAGVGPDERTCFVLSAEAAVTPIDVTVSIDDGEPAPATLDVLDRDEWTPDYVEAGLEPLVDVACLPVEATLEPLARVRVWFAATDEAPESGPWLVDVAGDDVFTLLERRYRYSDPGEIE